MDRNEIDALIILLDDPNPDVFGAVNDQLLSKGPDIIPVLEDAWEKSAGELFQKRIEDVIQKIQCNSICNSLEVWANEGGKDLLKGAYLVAKYQYPDLEYDSIVNQIDAIKNDVWLELNENLTALENVKILNHIIFDVHGFKKNSANYFTPRNCYINDVLSTKKGSSLILGIIYSSISQMLDLPISGVDLPQNFILAYKDEFLGLFPGDHEDNGMLFYINPFNKGAVFGRREIGYFIEQQKLEDKPEYYNPAVNTAIIYRLIEELIALYEKQGKEDKLSDVQRLAEVLRIQ